MHAPRTQAHTYTHTLKILLWANDSSFITLVHIFAPQKITAHALFFFPNCSEANKLVLEIMCTNASQIRCCTPPFS